MKKILVTGPESSGKTFLARELSIATNGAWVKEFARKYLESNSAYEQKDLLIMANGQKQWERSQWNKKSPYVFSDTGIEVFCIWSRVKFGSVDPKILSLLDLKSYDQILLCKPNIPWQFDPLREHPNERESLFEMYEDLLNREGVKFKVIDAPLEDRVQQALSFVV